MHEEDSYNNFISKDIFSLEKHQYQISESIHNDPFDGFLDINSFFYTQNEISKIDIESTFQTQILDSSSSIPISQENFSNQKPSNINQGVAAQTKSKAKSTQKKKKPDYKKNICGYISKAAIKQALSNAFKPTISRLCKKFLVNIEKFYTLLKNYLNITGITHLLSLLTPRLENLKRQEWEQEINIRIVFVTFFRWFIRHRYLRYIMLEGKMERKDEYLQYKNRELLFSITEEWRNLLIQMKQFLNSKKNQKIDGKIADDYIQVKYDELIEQNTVCFDANQFQEYHEEMIKQQNINQVNNPQEIEQEQQVKLEQIDSVEQQKSGSFQDWLISDIWQQKF